MGQIKLKIEDLDLTYNAIQFHFHSPAEHTFQGKYYPLELHIVHALVDGPKDYKYKNAVIGVFFDDTEDIENPFLKALMPEKPGAELPEKINVDDILKSLTKFYHYGGSLTTPPCTECVNWIVMTEVQKCSKKQILAFKNIWEHETEGCHNNRAIQPLNERKIFKNHL